MNALITPLFARKRDRDDGLNASRGVFNGLVVGLAMQVFAVAAWLLFLPGATP